MERDLWRWDAVELAAAIRTRRISSQEATRSVLERLAAVNPALNAVTVLLADEALAAADRADTAVRRGDALGPLHGVPVTIKENIDQEGVATPNGVPAFKDLIAKRQPAGGELEARGRRHRRPHQYAGLQPALAYRQRVARAHLQPVAPRAHAGRQQRRRRRTRRRHR